MKEERIIGNHPKTILNQEKDLFQSQLTQTSLIDSINQIKEDHLWLWINTNQKSDQIQIKGKINTQTFHHDFTSRRKQSNHLLRKTENPQFKDQEKDLKIEKKKLKQPLNVYMAHDLLIRNFQTKSFQNHPQNQILSIITKKTSKRRKTSLNHQMRFKKLIPD